MQKQHFITVITLLLIATHSSSMHNAKRLSSSLHMQKTFSSDNRQVRTPQIVFMYLLTQAAKDEEFKKYHLPTISAVEARFYRPRLENKCDAHFEDWVLTKTKPFSKILDYIPWDGIEHSDHRHTIIVNETKIDVFAESIIWPPLLNQIHFLTHDTIYDNNDHGTNPLIRSNCYHKIKEQYKALRHEMAQHE